MEPLQPLIESTRTHYAADRDLHRVVLNATSWVEANLAVEVLAESVSERMLVKFANIREAIKELPRCPIRMAIDFEGLSRVWDMERAGSAWSREFVDETGAFSVLVLGEGNYCYDIVVREGGRTLMWMPFNSEDDFLNPEIVDLLVERPVLLGTVVDLMQAMGLAFYPSFYLSLEDWRQEYAQTMFDEVIDLFGTEEQQRNKRQAEQEPVAAPARVRGPGSGAGISWLV